MVETASDRKHESVAQKDILINNVLFFCIYLPNHLSIIYPSIHKSIHPYIYRFFQKELNDLNLVYFTYYLSK